MLDDSRVKPDFIYGYQSVAIYSLLRQSFNWKFLKRVFLIYEKRSLWFDSQTSTENFVRMLLSQCVLFRKCSWKGVPGLYDFFVNRYFPRTNALRKGNSFDNWVNYPHHTCLVLFRLSGPFSSLLRLFMINTFVFFWRERWSLPSKVSQIQGQYSCSCIFIWDVKCVPSILTAVW